VQCVGVGILTDGMSTRAEEKKDNGNRRVAEGMARHEFEGSRQGARTRTTGADKDTRRGVELTGIVSVSPIPPFASGFTVNNCGHLTMEPRIVMCCPRKDFEQRESSSNACSDRYEQLSTQHRGAA